MGWLPGEDGGTGEEPDPGQGLPGGDGDPGASDPRAGAAGTAAEGAARHPRLSGFVKDGEWDACPPSAALAAALEGAAGADWRCPGATHDEMLGLLRQCQAVEGWAASARLGVLRALIREDDPGLPGIPRHGDLAAEWSRSLAHEVALALSMPAVSAQNLMWAAWDLAARLPGTGALLAGGALTFAKARAVGAALMLLSEQDAARAEAMIVPELPGKTYGQVEKLAVTSPHSRLCVTVTDQDGIAIGHGCARLIRRGTSRGRPASTPNSTAVHDSPGQDGQGAPGAVTPPALPARANLTITAGRLAQLAATTGPPGPAPWSLTPDTDPGPPGGFGTWTLTLPDGRNLTVALEPVPTTACDHRHESHAYQPNDTLRHLVQIRDGECTFPPCSRHARESDFEHAVPYDKGGKTCACNAGARSRQCHQVKQSRGWTVTQPKPGWHQWETPSGRIYTQAPKRYPTD
jgi:hypothetical protein